MVYNGYYKVMSNIPKMGQLPTPVSGSWKWIVVKIGRAKQWMAKPVKPESQMIHFT